MARDRDPEGPVYLRLRHYRDDPNVLQHPASDRAESPVLLRDMQLVRSATLDGDAEVVPVQGRIKHAEVQLPIDREATLVLHMEGPEGRPFKIEATLYTLGLAGVALYPMQQLRGVDGRNLLEARLAGRSS